jgi:hypothetical protein
MEIGFQNFGVLNEAFALNCNLGGFSLGAAVNLDIWPGRGF